jgi:predicted nuclease of predicted toxin-antitoxin system
LLRKLGYDVKAVKETSLKGHEDDEIVALAQTENRVIITLDLGFGSIYYFSKRGTVGIVLIRVHPPTIEDVNPVLINFLNQVNLDEKKLTTNLIVLNKNKYRVLK